MHGSSGLGHPRFELEYRCHIDWPGSLGCLDLCLMAESSRRNLLNSITRLGFDSTVDLGVVIMQRLSLGVRLC